MRLKSILAVGEKVGRYYRQYGGRFTLLAVRCRLRQLMKTGHSYRTILRMHPEIFASRRTTTRTARQWKQDIDVAAEGALQRLLVKLPLEAEASALLPRLKEGWQGRYYDVVQDLFCLDRFLSGGAGSTSFPILQASVLRDDSPAKRRRRILFVTSNFPSTEHGGGNRVANFIKILSEENDIYLCTAYYQGDDERALLALLPFCRSILKLPRWCFGGNQAAIRAWLGTTSMDVVHYEWPQSLENVDLAYGGTQVFTYMEAVSLRLLMDMGRTQPASEAWLAKLIELIHVLRVELVDAAVAQIRIAVTTKDADFFHRLYPYQEYAVLNHGISMEDFALPESAPQPNALVYVGNFRHYPNVDAMEFFFEEIWPMVRSNVPDVKVYLVGAEPPQSIVRLGDGEHVVVTGLVPDIRPWIQKASIGIAPLISGAGLRGKVLEYAALHRTFVATSIATTDLILRDGADYFRADHAEDFAAKVVTLLREPETARRMSANAYQTVSQNYDNRRLVGYLTRLYDRLEEGFT